MTSMFAGFETILQNLEFRKLGTPKPVKVIYAVKLSVPGQSMIIGSNSLASFLFAWNSISQLASVDERIEQISASPLRDVAFLSRYVSDLFGNELYAAVVDE